MKNKIHYSRLSLKDLDEIWEYIEFELSSPKAAEKIINGILNSIERLEEHALLGAPLSSITDIRSNYRFIIHGNHLTFYRVEGANIYVDRIIYGRRDYLRILLGNQEHEYKM